ncbi:MAG: hypothetical protein ITG02_13670 [Patulibacter sp.]|nr:hypothetical protein [Patulibacter sp.]
MRWSPTIALVAAIAGLMLTAVSTNGAEVVQDGSFEGGFTPSPWVQADSLAGRDLLSTGSPLCTATKGPPGAPTPGYCEDVYGHPDRVAPRSGSWWAWFGGYNFFDSLGNLFDPSPHSASLRQTVQLTAGTPATLSFWLWLGRADASSVLNVSLDGTLLASIRGDDARYKAGYAAVVVPVSGAAVTGGPQTLSFEYTGAVTLLQYPAINIDDVSLQVPDVDLGVAMASAPAAVFPGGAFTTTLVASNAGPHAAVDVTVAYPLPVGATLVGLHGDASCAAPQTAPGFVVHCDFGTLLPGASKAVALQFRAGAVGMITQAAAIARRSGDPNGGNELAHGAVAVVAPPVPSPDPRPEDMPTDLEDDEDEPECTDPERFTVPLRRGTDGDDLMIGKYRTSRARITSARLSGPKKFKTRRLKHTKSRVTVDFRTLPAGRYTVRTRVRVSSKRTISVNRIYEACGATAKSKAQAKRSAAKSKSSKASSKSTSSKAKSSSKKR